MTCLCQQLLLVFPIYFDLNTKKVTKIILTTGELNCCGGWNQWKSDKQMNRINQAIWRLPENSTFTLPDLLGYEWDNLTRGQKLSLAKRYVKTVYQRNKEGDYSVRLLHDVKNDRNNKPKQFRKEQTKDTYYS